MNVNNLFGSRNVRLAILSLLRFVPDKMMIRIEYRLKMRKKLHLNPPVKFNEKLQWLKLNDHNPIYTIMADKYEVRSFITEKIGEKYLVPIYGVWESIDEIPFDTLPNEFVMKCTHDSGSVIVVRDKQKLDINKAKVFLRSRLKKNAFWYGREWPYKNIKPRIIVEKLLKDEKYDNLPVFKIFCFNGEPKIIQQLQNDKQPNETVDYYDTQWTQLRMRQRFPNSKTPMKKPAKLEEMISLARILSNKIPFVRIDFYEVDGKVVFSENTFYTDSGYSIFEPDEEHWDDKLGEWLRLNNE